ncbi:MAG: cytochrome c oxidase accessory protein CcoG [Rhodothermales bacterium]
MTFIPADSLDILEAPDEVLTTLTRDGKRKWMYPTPSTGRFYRWRLIVGWALIAFFVGLPIVHVGGYPAVLLDFINREFALFGVVFYPTDTFLLMLLLIAGLVALVLMTALLGRVWCGWGCPQTVYMEFVFRPIERWIEGKEHVRKRRDDGPWTFDKAWRKSAKMGIFLVISLGLAHTFVAYFVGWEQLLFWMQQPPTTHWGFFLMMGITTGLILWDFGYFREQMCTITCPYARIQSVLLDPDSVIVAYDEGRGEPRARRSKKKMAEEDAGLAPRLGDCIDCFACVRTCPTGIDIRDGLQMECIACTQCIDACDAIMLKIDKPKGLIRYTSERELAGQKTRLLRGRTVIYSLLLVALGVIFTVALLSRSTYDINVGRAVGEPYTVLPDGRIANRLRFRVRNQTADATTFRVTIATPVGVQLNPVGPADVALDAGEMARTEAWVMVPDDAFSNGEIDATFTLEFADGHTETATFTLLGPKG